MSKTEVATEGSKATEATIVLLVLLSMLALATPTTQASNIGYRYRLSLAANGSNAGLYWISIPYLYTPPDSNGNLLVDVEDLVQDLQPDGLPRPCTPANADCAIARALVWDRTLNRYRT